MLDRTVVKQYIDDELADLSLELPIDISNDSLVESFCGYVEDDYYEWLRDNYKSFFNHGNPDWNWIRQRIKDVSK
jgi:hypothetical protein